MKRSASSASWTYQCPNNKVNKVGDQRQDCRYFKDHLNKDDHIEAMWKSIAKIDESVTKVTGDRQKLHAEFTAVSQQQR